MSSSTRTSRTHFSTVHSSAGETVTLQPSFSCKISKGTREIRWYKGTECVHREAFRSIIFLTLTDVKVTDSGQYRCESHGIWKKEVAVIYLHVADFKLVSDKDSLNSSQYFAGDDVTLSCHISPKRSAVTMEIRWFKEADCICVYQNGQVKESKGYEGRVRVFSDELEDGNVSLMLRNVQKSDDGMYKCKVVHGKDVVENYLNCLYVREFRLLTDMSDYSKHRRSGSSVCQPNNFYTCAGVQVTLPCYIFNLMSAVAMKTSWFKGTDCVCVYQNGKVKEGRGYEGRVSLYKPMNGNVSLVLRNVQESDDGEYTCEVTRQIHKTGIISVFLHVSGLKLTTEPYSDLVHSSTKSSAVEPHVFYKRPGDKVLLPCYLSAKVSAVAMTISWFKGTKCIFVHQKGKVRECRGYKGRANLFTQELENGNVSLVLNKFQASDVGEYKCAVTHTHPVTPSEHKMESSVLYIYMSEFHLTHIAEGVGKPSGPQSCVYMDVNTDVTLPCYLNPKRSAVSMEIRWFRDDLYGSMRRVCICEYQNGHVKEGKGYEGTVSLFTDKLKEGNVSLMLKNSQKTFLTGLYTCNVTCGKQEQSFVYHLLIRLRGGGIHYDTESSDDEDTPKTRTRKLSDPLDIRPIKPGRRRSNPFDFPNM